MDVYLTCAIFHKRGIDRRRSKERERERERERESHVILCSTLQLLHGGT